MVQKGAEMLVRKLLVPRIWLLPAMLLCALSGPVVADDPSRAQAESRPATRGMDFDVYIRLRKGMTEGELLERAGAPDHQTVEGYVGSKEVVRQSEQVTVNTADSVVKSFYYFPTSANPYTTVVTTTGGRITDLKRERKF
jgi:hypothetical protein